MDFTLTDEHTAMRAAVRELITRHLEQADPSPESAAPPQLDTGLWKALAEVGVLGLTWPEDVGGMDAGASALAVVATELGAHALQVPLADTALAGSVIAQTADDTLRTEILSGLVEGNAIPLPALAEPMRAWSSTPVDVTATEIDGTWRVTGTKAPVRYAADATHVVVSAATDRGTALLLVPAPAPQRERVVFEGTVATLLAIGEEADAVLRRALGLARVLLMAEASGAMDAALALTVDYLKAREQFGRPLAAFQTLTQRAADMYAETELARSAALFAAMAIDDDPDDTDHVLRAQVVVSDAARLVGQEAIQMHGGIGITTEHRVGHLTARLTDLDRTWGGQRDRLADLAARVGDHDALHLLG